MPWSKRWRVTSGAPWSSCSRTPSAGAGSSRNVYLGDGVGRPTLDDILDELARPGRDPRAEFKAFSFADVHSIDDLSVGMVLPGIVTNVTAFGAFVDIGVHQDGLVHVSQLADRRVKNPAEVVRVRQEVEVRVLQVDKERNRIGLSMRKG
jgi:protein Tex